MRRRRPNGTPSERNKAAEKQCAKCSRWLPESSFALHRATLDGLKGSCRKCISNEGRIRRWGLSNDDVLALLAKQDGCAICHISNAPWNVDHDHSCCPGRRSRGKCVRGVLCSNCNYAIGFAKEDPIVLANAMRYLHEWSTN